MPRELTHERLERIVHAPMALRRESPLAAQILALEEFDEPPPLEASVVEQAPEAEEAKVPRLAKVKGAVAVIQRFPARGSRSSMPSSDRWAVTGAPWPWRPASQLRSATALAAMMTPTASRASAALR